MNLRRIAWTALIALPSALLADLPIQINVDPGSGRAPISPYIYGTNQDLPGVTTPGVRRYGGNRLTGYNWETNASNAGTDYLNESDNYLVSGLGGAQQSVPAIALTSFHDQSLAVGTPYTVLTLQMAGYVSADESGVVTASQVAPSSRWNIVKNDTPGGVFPPSPNLADGAVYMDEVLNLLLSKYGTAAGSTGIKGYDLDNEPGLWPSTHPLLHPAQTTCAEIVSKGVALATTIKRMDPAAEVLGPVLYGSGAYFTFQSAPDWAAIQTQTGDRWFIDYYLDQLHQASTAAGKRLLDVLDLHRYSDENVSGSGPDQSITSQTDFSDTASDMDRVQAPRALWDATFVENSWVQQYYAQFLPWIPNLQASIAARYPGTKLSFSEYSFGGESDISGGIAQADVLGIFGKYGVYMGCIWILHDSPQPLAVAAAFKLYLDYDGAGGRFGNTSVAAADSDTVNSSAYASTDASGALHVVVLNKSFTQTAAVSFKIAGAAQYTGARVFAFDGGGSAISERAAAVVSGNQATYALAPLTAAHFIFAAASSIPQFTAQPVSQVVAGGTTVVFGAAASAGSYQWMLNGSPLSDGGSILGSAGPELEITGATAANAGTYTCVATSGAGTATSEPAVLTVSTTTDIGRLINISCRCTVGSGANLLIAGFVVGGAGTVGSEPLLVRGSGPALETFDVSGTLPDPELKLYLSNPDGSSTLKLSNEGWAGDPAVAAAASAVHAFSWGSAPTPDSALLATLSSGPYTAQVAGHSGDTGIALAEVFERTPPGGYVAGAPRLINISARATVGSGGNILIAGFVIGGSTSRTVLVRASGPALGAFGVSGTLPDPGLKLLRSNADGSSTLLGSNTGWGADALVAAAAASVGAFSWGAAPTRDSAILMTLPPGAYTAQIAGASGDTGLALVEVYEVP